jgi:hypothetical protein
LNYIVNKVINEEQSKIDLYNCFEFIMKAEEGEERERKGER